MAALIIATLSLIISIYNYKRTKDFKELVLKTYLRHREVLYKNSTDNESREIVDEIFSAT